jgi:hypothetical protein
MIRNTLLAAALGILTLLAGPALAHWQPPPRWNPMMRRNPITGTTIYQPMPGNPLIRDRSAPTLPITPEAGTIYQMVPGNPTCATSRAADRPDGRARCRSTSARTNK